MKYIDKLRKTCSLITTQLYLQDIVGLLLNCISNKFFRKWAWEILSVLREKWFYPTGLTGFWCGRLEFLISVSCGSRYKELTQSTGPFSSCDQSLQLNFRHLPRKMILCQHAVMLGLDISLAIDKDVLFGAVFSSRHKIF